MRKKRLALPISRAARKNKPAPTLLVALALAWLVFGCGLLSPGTNQDPLYTLSPTLTISTMTPPPSPVEIETVTALEIPATQTPRPTEPLASAVPFPTPAWSPSSIPSDAELEAMIAAMSLQDKVAQMVMVGFHGQSIANSSELATMVGAYHVGGVVLLEANSHDPQQLSHLTTELQSLAMTSGAGIPLFISINHEGGIVVRITEGVTKFPGNMAVAATGQSEYAYVSAALAARELRAMGVNMNLAPVLDVNYNPLNPIIGVRSFGASAELTARYGQLAVQGSQDNGVMAVVKHFPGHGGVDVDSHGGLGVLPVSADELKQRELVPFQAAIQQRAAGIMTAHIAVPALDASGQPATLSYPILTGLLRQQMGYEGLIMTDSLGMGGISASKGQAQAAVEAVQAGADILLSTSPMEAHIAIIQALAGAVQQGEISVERIDQSLQRILRAKYAYGLFEPLTADLSIVGSPEHQAIADEIALQAVTLLRDDAGNIPLPPSPAQLLLISPDQLPPAISGGGSAFAELLREKGYEVIELVFNLDSGDSRNYVYQTAVASAPAYDAVVFGEWELIKRYVNWDDQWQEGLIGALYQANSALTVIAWHNPAAIVRCSQTPTFLVAYGNTPAQVAAVVAVLVGEQNPMGSLPMSLLENGE